MRLLFAKVRVGECIDLQQELENLDSIRCMLRLLAWFLAAIILIVLSIFAAVIRPTFEWRLWPAIWRARLNIKAVARKRVATAEVVSRQGATKISPGHLSFGIRTRTDRERDILCQDPGHSQGISRCTRQSWLPGRDPPGRTFRYPVARNSRPRLRRQLVRGFRNALSCAPEILGCRYPAISQAYAVCSPRTGPW